MAHPAAPVETGVTTTDPETPGSLPEYLIDPIAVGENLVVNNVYALPPEESPEPRPDVDSHVAFTEYAFSRFDPRFAGSDPTLVQESVVAPAWRVRRGEGWVGGISPRLSMGFFLATTALHSLVGNMSSLAADTREEINNLLYTGKQVVTRWTGHQFGGTETKAVETTKPGQVIVLNQNYPQPVGESAPSQSDITKLVGEIADEQSKGNTVTKITIFAGSSDEWGPDESTLQVPNEQNDALDDRRANDAANELRNQLEAAGLDVPEIEITTAEGILSADEVAGLKAAASHHNISLEDAIRIYNQGGKLPKDLQNLLQTKLGDARSVVIRVEIQEPDQTVTRMVTVNETAPEDKDHDYALYWGLPLPFFPRLRREDYLKAGYATWLRPGAKPDERWVELYKEAMQEDGTLPRDAWRYTRKYQLLAREDRIDYVLSHNYTDADGEERDMRVMFVDHDPTEETVEMYKQLLTAVSQMRDGKVAERWSAITVFPRAQVGTHTSPGRAGDDYPHNPADIGLDIDKQDPRNVLGVAMPALGLTEVHMPENPTEAELHDYLGALWVASHEFAGHATDTTGEPITLIPTGPAIFRHYRTTNVWADTAQTQFAALPDVDAPGARELDVTWRVATPDNDIITLTDHVSTEDGNHPILGVSHSAELQGRKPNSYSGSSPAELYAEAAGQLVSGAMIPYSEAGLNVTARDPRLARGYGVGTELRNMFIERTGWDPATPIQVNDDAFALTLATDDPMLRPWIDEARRTPMPNDRITILAGVVGLSDPDQE